MCFLALLVLLSGNGHAEQVVFSAFLDSIDAPRPWLEKKTFMSLAYAQAKKAGATKKEIAKMRRKAHEESRDNPRVCVSSGCGPFGQRIWPLAKPFGNTLLVRNAIRWLLTNKPGYSARIALDMIQRCERLAGTKNWHCCYGGAYRSWCRIKWDKRYRERKTSPDTKRLTSSSDEDFFIKKSFEFIERFFC